MEKLCSALLGTELVALIILLLLGTMSHECGEVGRWRQWGKFDVVAGAQDRGVAVEYLYIGKRDVVEFVTVVVFEPYRVHLKCGHCGSCSVVVYCSLAGVPVRNHMDRG